MQSRSYSLLASALAAVAALAGPIQSLDAQQMPARWKQHELKRPRPQAVAPVDQTLPAPVPRDAIVLFGGTDLSRWRTPAGAPAEWKVENGYFEVVPGKGTVQTREEFGDVQLHVEWASPNPPRGRGQDRGNSGVFLMGRYEVQVLDSYQAETYADGQAGALYGQYPPLYNASRAPGEWQSYDIYFRRPRFSSDGRLLEPARVTVVHNGILVQNNEEFRGPTSWQRTPPYTAHPDKGPIQLQDHGHPVRFRNIWVRPIAPRPEPDAAYLAGERPIELAPAQLDRFAGEYLIGEQNPTRVTIRREGSRLLATNFFVAGVTTLVPVSPTEFASDVTGGRVVFQLDAQGRPTGLVFHMGGSELRARRAQ